MDQEKLIENVKSCEALYVTSHSRYSDTGFKENAWRAIAKEMNQSANVCKKTWTSLRDSFRRAMKKKREMKSGQAASKIKKWKFEDEMSFLLPYMRERVTYTNLTEVEDGDNEDEQNTDKCYDNNDDTEDDRNDNRSDDEDKDSDDDVDKNEPNAENERTKKQSKINRNIITKVDRNKENKAEAQSKTSSAVVIKYLKKKTDNDPKPPPTEQSSAIESFFSSIATTVEKFSPYYQNIAKSKIFTVVTDLEMQQIMQEQQSLLPNLPAQRSFSTPTTRIQLRSHKLHQTGQYNVDSSPLSSSSSSSSSLSVSTVTTPSHSSSPIATPTPPSVHHRGLSEENPKVHEEIYCNKYTEM